MTVPTISLTLGVDDTGNDAMTGILAESLVRHRVTLTAAILHREQVSAFLNDWRALIAELNSDFVIDEIHAAHLVNSSIPLRNRLSKKAAKQRQWEGWCDALALLRKHMFVFVAQTAHAESVALLKDELRSLGGEDRGAVAERLDESSGGLKRAAWLQLTRRVAQEARYLVGDSPDVRLDVEWHVDSSTDFDRLEPELERLSANGYYMWSARFAPSAKSCLIQAADCAGYVLNRHQYMLAARRPEEAGQNEKDRRFFKATELVAQSFLGTFKTLVRTADAHHLTYDELVARALAQGGH